MKKTIFLLCVIAFFTEINAMKRHTTRQILQEGPKKQKLVQEIPEQKYYSKPTPFNNNDLFNAIIDIAIDKKINKNSRDATYTINTLYFINKSFKTFINKFSDRFIKKIALDFYCSHETIAKQIYTPSSQARLHLQFKLKQWCCSRHYHIDRKEQFYRLIEQGVDLEFTHNHYGAQKTPLMLAVTHSFNTFTTLLPNVNINNKVSLLIKLIALAFKFNIRRER